MPSPSPSTWKKDDDVSTGRSRSEHLPTAHGQNSYAQQLEQHFIEVKRSYDGLKQLSLMDLVIAIFTFPWEYTRGLYEKAQKSGPLPPDFDYSYALAAYSYRTTTLVSYTIGLRLGSLSCLNSLLEAVFSPAPLFLLVFLLMPFYAIILHRRTSLARLSIIDRIVLLYVHSFLSGILVAHLLRHYISPSSSPPVYFVPAVISLVIYQFGPQLSENRVTFVAATVGSATGLSVLLSALFGSLSINTLVAIAIQTASALIYVQNLIHDVLNGETDLVQGNLMGLLLTQMTYLAYKVIMCPYRPEELDSNLPSITGIFAA